MDEKRLRALLKDVKTGRTSLKAAVEALRAAPVADLDFARVDTHRELRCGFPEVIFCEGKTPAQVARIAKEIVGRSGKMLATRALKSQFTAVKKLLPRAKFHTAARAITCETKKRAKPAGGEILVVSAGTSDIPVAEEARVTAEIMGNRVRTLYDVGVAGIHRLLGHAKEVREARVLIVVAGMEGALASVVGGMVSRPVVAVPTSVGYGASFGGIAPLLTMLNSCAAGVTVVNIDNGFGAGYAAALMNRPDEED